MDFNTLFAISLVIGKVLLITVAALFVTAIAAILVKNISTWFAHSRHHIAAMVHRLRHPGSISYR